MSIPTIILGQTSKFATNRRRTGRKSCQTMLLLTMPVLTVQMPPLYEMTGLFFTILSHEGKVFR